MVSVNLEFHSDASTDFVITIEYQVDFENLMDQMFLRQGPVPRTYVIYDESAPRDVTVHYAGLCDKMMNHPGVRFRVRKITNLD
uniref:Uncharacterized protein n=1 Tax=Tetranychus urticae TaxID=32264 RepID=T1KA21_TETUR